MVGNLSDFTAYIYEFLPWDNICSCCYRKKEEKWAEHWKLDKITTIWAGILYHCWNFTQFSFWWAFKGICCIRDRKENCNGSRVQGILWFPPETAKSSVSDSPRPPFTSCSLAILRQHPPLLHPHFPFCGIILCSFPYCKGIEQGGRNSFSYNCIILSLYLQRLK